MTIINKIEKELNKADKSLLIDSVLYNSNGIIMSFEEQAEMVLSHIKLFSYNIPHTFFDKAEYIINIWLKCLTSISSKLLSKGENFLLNELKKEAGELSLLELSSVNQQKYNFIDLFAGCGGLSEGFYRNGFTALAHVDFDHWACETLRTRMKHYGYTNYQKEVIEQDINSKDIIELLDEAVNGRKVDVIIGGPPCQAYSTAGRVRDGKRMAEDPRNFLFESYVKILEHYKPKFFVFENVTGILSAKVNGSLIFPKIIKALGKKYRVINDPELLVHNTADYGVPQLRKRVIIMGVRKDIPNKDVIDLYKSVNKTHWNPETPEAERLGRVPFVDVRHAIGDLPVVEPGMDVSTPCFNYLCNNSFLKRIGKPGIAPLMDQQARNQNALDRERFTIMIHNHWSFGQLRREMPQYEHKKARVFDNSYVVQWWDLPSKTILAHLYKDGFQFIHPDEKQARTFTVREAARIQSFPDDFVFEGSRTEKFKQIGNAVPPLFAEALAIALKTNLDELNL